MWCCGFLGLAAQFDQKYSFRSSEQPKPVSDQDNQSSGVMAGWPGDAHHRELLRSIDTSSCVLRTYKGSSDEFTTPFWHRNSDSSYSYTPMFVLLNRSYIRDLSILLATVYLVVIGI